MKLYRNNRNGTFTDVTRQAGLDIEMYGMGVAVGDYDNDGFPDLYVTCVGQSRLFQNTGQGTFVDVTEKAGLGGRLGFSSSALWFDYDRDGLLDLFVCNYVKWSPELDVFCTVDGKQKQYCTPEAYRGATCWLFHNRGNGTFEDVTAQAGIFDSSSKSLGVAMFDYDNDGWPDLFVANDTEPNKLYRNLRNGTVRGRGGARRRGLQRGRQGARRDGRGCRRTSTTPASPAWWSPTSITRCSVSTRRTSAGIYVDKAPRFGAGPALAPQPGVRHVLLRRGPGRPARSAGGQRPHRRLQHACSRDVQYAMPPHLFLNRGPQGLRGRGRRRWAAGFAEPKVGRGAAFADFDRDGDVDVLITTNHGPAYLYRNDQLVREPLDPLPPDRHEIQPRRDRRHGAHLLRRRGQLARGEERIELPFAIGAGADLRPGKRDKVDRAVIAWPSGRVEEYKNLAGRLWECTEGKGVRDTGRF